MRNLINLSLLICIISLIFFSCSDKNQKTDCSRLKRGVFQAREKTAPFRKFTIQRNDSFQLVKNETTGKIDKERVDWIDQCTYKIKGLDENDSYRDSLVNTLKIEVTDITDKYYLIHVYDEPGKISFKDTMWILGSIGGFRSIGDTYKTP